MRIYAEEYKFILFIEFFNELFQKWIYIIRDIMTVINFIQCGSGIEPSGSIGEQK